MLRIRRKLRYDGHSLERAFKTPVSNLRTKHHRPVLYRPICVPGEFPALEPREEPSWISDVPPLNRLAERDRPASGRILRLEIGILAAIIGFGFLSVRTLTQQEALRNLGMSQERALLNLALSVANGNAKVNGLSQSVESVTAALAESSSKIGEFSSQLGRRENQIQDLNSRLQTMEVDLRKAQQVRWHANDTTASLPTIQPPSVSSTELLANSHLHQIDASIPMPAGALGHQNSRGELDYWLVTRLLPSGERFAKVQPYGTSSFGVKVHSLEDGTDYTLTPEGDWVNAQDNHSPLVTASPRHPRTHRR